MCGVQRENASAETVCVERERERERTVCVRAVCAGWIRLSEMSEMSEKISLLRVTCIPNTTSNLPLSVASHPDSG